MDVRRIAAIRGVGMLAQRTNSRAADVPFPFSGGVRLRDQAQFDPVELVDSLAADLEQHGGRIVEGARLRRVSGFGTHLRLQVRTSAGDVIMARAPQLVLATGVPILDRGGFFARLKAQRSYCMAFDVLGGRHPRHVHLHRFPDPVRALCANGRR